MKKLNAHMPKAAGIASTNVMIMGVSLGMNSLRGEFS